MAKLVQLLFYHRDADCFFIAQSGCGLGLTRRFGIIAALSPRGIMPAIYGVIWRVWIAGMQTAQLNI
ncbi:hypothetical protein [Aeromonas allosaccharophila]|uniref:hypothetical protein n=1 Tax=Aeromonas allosaccharophila TaxID=656 RepID=UPI003D1A2E91